MFHLSRCRDFKHYYLGYVCKHFQNDFPQTVSYNRFVELMQRAILPMVLYLKTRRMADCTLSQPTVLSARTSFYGLILYFYPLVPFYIVFRNSILRNLSEGPAMSGSSFITTFQLSLGQHRLLRNMNIMIIVLIIINENGELIIQPCWLHSEKSHSNRVMIAFKVE